MILLLYNPHHNKASYVIHWDRQDEKQREKREKMRKTENKEVSSCPCF